MNLIILVIDDGKEGRFVVGNRVLKKGKGK